MASRRNMPVLIAYYVGKNGKLNNIGAAWPTKDGSGFSVKLDHLPSNGKLLLFPNKKYISEEVVDNFKRHVV